MFPVIVNRAEWYWKETPRKVMVVLLCLYNTVLTKVPSYERLEYLGIVVPKYSDLNILFKMGQFSEFERRTIFV